MITKIAFVAQPTHDMERAKKFYGEALGLRLDADYENCWAEYQAADGKSIALDTFSPKQSDGASPYLALESDDIEADVAKAREGGAQVIKDVWTNEHEGKEICKMAILLDPEGNPLMLHQIATWRQEEGS